MPYRNRFGIALVLFMAAISTAAAHQPIDKEAPSFALRDADRRPVLLAGFVVVLHFIYTNCPDVCPLHAERISRRREN